MLSFIVIKLFFQVSLYSTRIEIGTYLQKFFQKSMFLWLIVLSEFLKTRHIFWKLVLQIPDPSVFKEDPKSTKNLVCRMSGVLYEEIFDIKSVDPEGKQFERVKRIHAECESSKMELILDVNSMLYNPSEGDKVMV